MKPQQLMEAQQIVAGTDLDKVCSRVQTARRSARDEALAYFTKGKEVFKKPQCLHFTLDGVQAPGFLRKV